MLALGAGQRATLWLVKVYTAQAWEPITLPVPTLLVVPLMDISSHLRAPSPSFFPPHLITAHMPTPPTRR